mgnify:CR=1 FL=1
MIQTINKINALPPCHINSLFITWFYSFKLKNGKRCDSVEDDCKIITVAQSGKLG